MNTHDANTEMAPILVTGGTGTLGRLVVERLMDAGHRVKVLSRNAADDMPGVDFATADLDTGEGVRAAVQGAQIVLHCAGSAKGDEDKARHLVEAAVDAGVRHLVYISVVGADKIPVVTRTDRNMFGYFASKRSAELTISESGIPWTTLRATQFSSLVYLVAEAMAKLPIVPLPRGLRAQPVDASEVADRLVELTLGEPSGLVDELGGPEVHDAADLLRGYLKSTGRRRPIVRIGLPGNAARAMLGGANLTPQMATGRRTWGQFLSERAATPAA